MNALTDPRIFAAPELRFATLASGTRVPYVASGAGEPLLFVHGSLCDYRYWNSQTDVLSAHFYCVSISLSHYWPVADAGTRSVFSLSTHVAELAEFIAAMNVGPVHLVGHSRGGCVAFQLARAYPALVKTLTLADPAGPLHIDGIPEASLSTATNAVRARAADLIAAGAIDAGLELFVDSVSMPGTWRKSPAGFRAMAMDNASTLAKQFADPLPAYTRAAASDVQCRTLLIEGGKSPQAYRDNVEKLAGWIKQVDKRSIAGASHGMNVTHPSAFNRMIQAFAASPAAPG